MQPTFNNLFAGFHKNSKIWIYLANRPMNAYETKIIEKELDLFVKSWDSHGSKLEADYSIILDYFILITVNEGNASISGCSIDKSIHFMKDLGEKLNIDFFNRLNVLSIQDSGLKLMKYPELIKLKRVQYFNPIINTLDELRNKWIIQTV
jgi:hypothetical protein